MSGISAINNQTYLIGKQVVLCLLFALTGLLSTNMYSAERFPEYQIKALFMLNFGHYTKWPKSIKTEEELHLCIVGFYPFENYFSAKNLKKIPIKRSINIKKLRSIDSFDGCQVVFISQKEEASLKQILDRTRGKPLLTVGESPNFIRNGGVVYLKIVGETVTFEVNLDAQREAGIILSSRFLDLATKVYGKNSSSVVEGIVR